MGKLIDLTGEKIGRLTVLYKEIANDGERPRWACLCECGNKKTIASSSLIRGLTKSCGCLRRQELSRMRKIHGMSTTRQYNIWRAMIGRCNNPKHPAFKNYGGRGIVVCPQWRESFIVFWEDMKGGYEDDLTIDRINNDGSYEPGNCTWSTYMEQSHNRRAKVNSKTGICGVYLSRNGKYKAQIMRNHKKHYLGTFDNPQDAVRARKIKEEKLSA